MTDSKTNMIGHIDEISHFGCVNKETVDQIDT